jgi:conjugal transfer pilus assembly protein TraB
VVAALARLVATAPDQGDYGEAERRLQVANLLTDVDPRDLGINGLGGRMNALEGELRKLAYGLAQLGLDAADSEGASGARMPRSFILTDDVSVHSR